MEAVLSKQTRQLIEDYVPDLTQLRTIAALFSVLGDSTRMKILSGLSITPMCVSDITDTLKLNQTTVSHQLKTMRDMGLVDFYRSGKKAVYFIAKPKLLDVLSTATEILV